MRNGKARHDAYLKCKGDPAMAVCHVSVVESLSDSWLRVLGMLRGRRPDDEMRRATMMLTKSIEATTAIELSIGAELADLSCRARTLRNKHVKADLVALLTSSKHKRLRLQQTVRKRLALEQHLETLQSTLLNQQVMSSVKHTSEVLKSMGLEHQLSCVEEMNLDMHETLADVGAIQDGLAAGGLFPVDDDMDFDTEMELLLQLDPFYAEQAQASAQLASKAAPPVSASPAVLNHMRQEPAFADAASAEPTLADPNPAAPAAANPAAPAAAIALAGPVHIVANGASAAPPAVTKQAELHLLSEEIA